MMEKGKGVAENLRLNKEWEKTDYLGQLNKQLHINRDIFKHFSLLPFFRRRLSFLGDLEC